MSQSTQSPAGQVSEDGQWIWNGAEWVPNTAVAASKKAGIGKKVLIGGGAAFGLLILVGMAAGSDEGGAGSETNVSQEADSSEAKSKPAVKDEPEPNTPGIGDKAADGKFTFVVNGVREGGTSIGDQFLSTEAQGRFILVDVKVKNTGNEAQTLFGDDNVLLDDKGREFSFDSEAAIYVDQDSWIEDINPGNSTTVTMVFDVPKKVKPTEIRLHDSMLSEGVTVALS